MLPCLDKAFCFLSTTVRFSKENNFSNDGLKTEQVTQRCKDRYAQKGSVNSIISNRGCGRQEIPLVDSV